jgi:putative ABC transport system ATP-binding protein
MSEPLITAQKLHKRFQVGRVAVNAIFGLDLQIESNTFWTVMGPSGSGKSTLLYLLGGLDRPTSGNIRVDGLLLNELDENRLAIYRRQTVGFIFQSFNLIPSMSALENVAFPLRFARVPRHERQSLANQLLQQVDLGDRMHHNPTELSGGEQQRVAIARALVNNPRLILADEPTGNLDSASGDLIMQLLGTLHEQGRTVVVVSHDPRMTAYATHTANMLDGRFINGVSQPVSIVPPSFEVSER